MSKIAVIEDDPSITRLLELVLSKEGFDVATFADGDAALEGMSAASPDLFMVDLMLPSSLGGIGLIKRLRERREYAKVPIMVLTARDQMVDRYEAFSAGADDYLTKPFDPMELIFRIRAFLRLTSQDTRTSRRSLAVADMRLEPARLSVFIGDEEIRLTKLETTVLYHFMSHPGEIFSAEDLASHVLGGGAGNRTVDAAHAHIRNLRQKIETDPKNPQRLVTKGRRGYYLAE